MRLTPTDRQDVYLCFMYVYKVRTGSTFKWKRGEKGRVLKTFTKLCEDFSYRENEQFPDAILRFEEYLKNQSLKWLAWVEANRNNYVGFMYNRDNISIFAASSVQAVQKPEVTGFSNSEAWNF